jgi:hypothetical protein
MQDLLFYKCRIGYCYVLLFISGKLFRGNSSVMYFFLLPGSCHPQTWEYHCITDSLHVSVASQLMEWLCREVIKSRILRWWSGSSGRMLPSKFEALSSNSITTNGVWSWTLYCNFWPCHFLLNVTFGKLPNLSVP